MTEHNIFYYPYASFTNAQVPLLKIAALYSDHLYILDPEKASGGIIGVGEVVATHLEGAPFHLPLSTPVTVGGATIFTLKVDRYEEI